MFDTVLIANRGEIAVRIIRACHALGMRAVAVYSVADRDSPHVDLADRAVCIGPGQADQSYLNQVSTILACRLTGAGAIHPGYGFLSENASFAERADAAGLVFIGPAADTIRLMGDKISAKRAMIEAGVPCVAGDVEPIPAEDAAAHRLADAIGYPVIVKAASGGGGRGMRVVRDPSDLLASIAVTREEARRSFGDPSVYLEKYLDRPRHVEIQVLCDGHGNGIHLGDRDCTLQRRHQKVLEESPSPGISREALDELGTRCVAACRRIGYAGLGTFEFLYQDGQFAFIEMNTRVQVEHPVTEMTTGFDLVQAQIAVAMGERLPWNQSDLALKGHAVECRINAENIETGMASTGMITKLDIPEGPGIRFDSGVRVGTKVSRYYDGMIAKLIVHGTDRMDAIGRMKAALSGVRIKGVDTNIALQEKLLSMPEFLSGTHDIHSLERLMPDLSGDRPKATAGNAISR